MKLRLSLVTLGVADVARATAFYGALGLTPGAASNPSVSFFDMDGVLLGLYGRDSLAQDAGVAAQGQGFRAASLAWNLGSEAEVDAAYARALASGATAVKVPARAVWGGWSGYFADPDGHLWEIAHNPFFPIDARGVTRLPEVA